MKLLLTSIALLTVSCCFAQRQNVYFLKNNGTYVDSKDSADYIRLVREPDSTSTLYNVFEFYLDGKKKLIGKSSTIDPPVYDGQCIEYYKNGSKKSLINYVKSKKAGTDYEYYPNGKMYTVREYPESGSLYGDLESSFLIKANYDSLGTQSVVNGDGYYKGYDDKFTYVIEEGGVKDGKRINTWKGNLKYINTTFIENYQDGVLISGTANHADGTVTTYSKQRGTAPEFKGGVVGFGKYLSRSINYPDYARANNIQGIVVLSFIVEKDGKLSEVKVRESVNPLLDEEAVRVLKQSPKWQPGTMFGSPIRVTYSVPVNFKLN